jgi:excinuclease UvrABC nuclease subunit
VPHVGPVAVYRLFDEHDELLYIGVANRPEERLSSHRGSKRWWREVARVDLAWHDDRAAAEEAEDLAIIAEAPRYNIMVRGADGRRHARRDVSAKAFEVGFSPWYRDVIKGTMTR